MIAILDYGAGNLRSVQNTLDEIGAAYRVVTRDISGASKVILPGVGHFGQMMRSLDIQAVRDAIATGVPFLGICLGLQALFEGSDEDEAVQGLGLFPGRVKRFPLEARVPHMGWNDLTITNASKLIQGRPYLYFAHSYYCPVVEGTAATCNYAGVTYTAVLEHNNIMGVQFHPEKSGPAGLEIVRRFAAC